MSLIFIFDPVFTPLSGALFNWYIQSDTVGEFLVPDHK